MKKLVGFYLLQLIILLNVNWLLPFIPGLYFWNMFNGIILTSITLFWIILIKFKINDIKKMIK